MKIKKVFLLTLFVAGLFLMTGNALASCEEEKEKVSFHCVTTRTSYCEEATKDFLSCTNKAFCINRYGTGSTPVLDSSGAISSCTAGSVRTATGDLVNVEPVNSITPAASAVDGAIAPSLNNLTPSINNPPSATSCSGTGQSTCPSGQVCIRGACTASPSRSCSPACTNGNVCSNGACVPSAIQSNSNNTQNSQPTDSSSTSFTNPLQFENVEGFLGGIMSAIQKIIVVLALVFIMIGAVMILASAGNSGMVEQGKGAITMAFVGLAIGIAAPSLLKELANIIGWGGVTPAALTLSEIAVRVLNFLLGIMGILALIMMVIGAIMYLTSAGDEDRIDKGKEIFKYSLIGIFLAMASMVLVKQVALFFV